MNIHDGLLKIGDFARFANTNLRTLRYYEELGLLTPAARSAGGFRYYRPTDVNRVRLIWDLQNLGLQLEGIAELLLRARDEELTHEALLQRVRGALEEHDRLLLNRLKMLQEQRDSVRLALVKLDECHTCPHHPSASNNFCEPCRASQMALPDLLSALF